MNKLSYQKLQGGFVRKQNAAANCRTISCRNKMLLQIAGRFRAETKCCCKLQGDFVQKQNVAANCRTISCGNKMPKQKFFTIIIKK